VERLDDLAPEDLVARLHVGQVEVGHHVRQGGEQPVADRMPVVEDPVRRAGDEARPEHDVGQPVLERLQQRAVLAGVVLEVGVLHQDVVGAGLGEPTPQGGALAPVLGLQQHPHPRVGEPGEDVAGPVGRSVVDDHHLGGPGRGEDLAHDDFDGPDLVEARNDDGQAGSRLAHPSAPPAIVRSGDVTIERC
jgi:hypothetical protein